jgi:hypothetical protein
LREEGAGKCQHGDYEKNAMHGGSVTQEPPIGQDENLVGITKTRKHEEYGGKSSSSWIANLVPRRAVQNEFRDFRRAIVA